MKEIIFETMTFKEVIEYGKNNGGNIINGMPWSFSIKGFHFTNENDHCYIISVPGGSLKFTPDDLFITDQFSKIYPLQSMVKL